MKLLPLALAPLLLLAGQAATASDARVRSIMFTPDEVVRFIAKPGYQSSIRFGADERIENVAVGDSAAWQVTPNKRGNYLFIKPLIAGARSNLMVITDQRTYLFDLEATRGSQPVYTLSFDYPAYPAPGSIQPPPPPPPAPAATTALASAPVTPAPVLNFGWKVDGAKSLRPARIFDDSKAVYLSWPDALALPAVLAPASDGTESPLDYRMEKGFIVIAGLPRRIILRRGKETATVLATSNRVTLTQTASTEARNGRP
ncbi:TrbG/VirB9 family P-type conjugative transfer protein [Sphingomonas kaistensis]|uniref:TrbG/VirB9 family P-type conjugative transfer protein n=1 Tax=Sphingomonas kaistensis TaxID=298708 RepID=A0ABZ2G4I1_9SPHN